ncbi:unnamed protein product [Mytilus edulis]|uniref:B box-type domain-containing protein n=1 Tax=Mytilus edulis TaxID=6550 RepID=A0A8S3QAP8_MYTED|nr:unnamed protein product [Mytilus edulis]
MAANYCEPCTARGIKLTASQWCTECEEDLCSDCTEVHRVQKISRNHHLVEIDICCKEFWPKNHQACRNVISIDIASKNSKQSQSFLDSEEQLSFILETLEKLRQNFKDNGSRINQEETQILKQIKILKENIIKKLEALEETLSKQISEKKDKYLTSFKRQEKYIMDLVNSLKAEKEALEFIRDHGSDKQMFVSIHSSTPVLHEIENKVKQLSETFAETSLIFIQSNQKKQIADFGSIELKETPCSFPFVPYKQCQSQVPVVLNHQKTSFTHLYNINMKGRFLQGVSGLTVSDNNRLICCDVQKKGVYFCDENEYQIAVSTPYDPWDIASIPGTTTAVLSSRYEPFIQFIDLGTRRIFKHIEVKQSGGYVIAATKDNIFVGTEKEIQVLDIQNVLSGHFERTVSLKHGQGPIGNISVSSNGNICYSNNHKIFCTTSDGEFFSFLFVTFPSWTT